MPRALIFFTYVRYNMDVCTWVLLQDRHVDVTNQITPFATIKVLIFLVTFRSESYKYWQKYSDSIN